MLFADLICNIFYFFMFNLFISYTCQPKTKPYVKYVKLAYFSYAILYSWVPVLPFCHLLFFTIDAIYFFTITNNTIIKKSKKYLTYNIYFYVSSFFIMTFHTLFTQDLSISISNDLYFSYKSIICSALQYIILSIYITTKRISAFPSGRTYKWFFLAITGLSVVLLTVCSMLLGSTLLEQEDVLPMIFCLLIIITVLFLSVYRNLIKILEENTLTKIEVEKNALQQDYYAHIKNNLESLSLLRHDFKNHLYILNSYAEQHKTEKIIQYIQSIQETLAPTTMIQTPSPLLSSLLNAKNEDCKIKGVHFTFQQDFSLLKISDFNLVTIMSNLLDNAITAAAKCENGTVALHIYQLDSNLEIDCTNTHQEKLLPKGNILLTTKSEQKEIHGIGITSMRKAVDSLHGQITIDYTDDIFHVLISVPNYE